MKIKYEKDYFYSHYVAAEKMRMIWSLCTGAASWAER